MDKKLRRCNIFLPINKNTRTYINDLLISLEESFDGCTYSRFHYPPIHHSDTKINGYFIGRYAGCPEEDVVYIIVDIDLIKYPNIYTDLAKIVDCIKHLGEKEIWLTYYDVLLDK